MKASSIVYIFVASLALFASSCKSGVKKVVKEATKKTIKESAERGAKEGAEKVAKESAEGLAKESAESGLRSATKRQWRALNWDDFVKTLRKQTEHLNLSEGLSKLNGSFRKKIVKGLQEDYGFYWAFMSPRKVGVLDEFALFTKDAPKAIDNADLFRHFTKGRYLETRLGFQNVVGHMKLTEELGTIKLLRKADGKVLGELRDGILNVKGSLSELDQLVRGSSAPLLPKTIYRFKGADGVSLAYRSDDLGRITQIRSTGLSVEQFLSKVAGMHKEVRLGGEWAKQLQALKSLPKGSKIDGDLAFKYVGEEVAPMSVDYSVQMLGKGSLDNLANVARRKLTPADYAKVLDEFGSKVGLPASKRPALLAQMKESDELGKKVCAKPEQYIKSWLNTQNPVDASQVARTASGRFVPNGRTYAGNTYYFDPALNPGLRERLAKGGGKIQLKNAGTLTEEELDLLAKRAPGGIPFSKRGFSDFEGVAFRGRDGKVLKVDIGKLTVDPKKDIAKAETLFQKMGYKWEEGWTWHHVENSTILIRVPTTAHQLVDHGGGVCTDAVVRAITKQAIKQVAEEAVAA